MQLKVLIIVIIGCFLFPNEILCDTEVNCIIIDTNAGVFEFQDSEKEFEIEFRPAFKNQNSSVSLAVGNTNAIESVSSLLKSTDLISFDFKNSYWVRNYKSVRSIENSMNQKVRCQSDVLRNKGELFDESGLLYVNSIAVQYKDGSCLFLRSSDLFQLVDAHLKRNGF
jgi:hypothetical protein